MAIIRGTTPHITMKIPCDVAENEIAEAHFTFAQNGSVIVNKRFSDGDVEYLPGGKMSTTLTQMETLALAPNVNTEAQIRIMTTDGMAYANQPYVHNTYDVVLDGEIYDGVRTIKKIEPYAYTAYFGDIDYDAGYQFYEQYKPEIGACSVVAKGNLIGRHYDWYYDDRCSFVITTPAKDGRHKVTGCAQAPTGLTQAMIDAGEDSDLYDVIPFLLLDGYNDAGLFCEINVVPAGDKGYTTGTHEGLPDMCAPMLVRYLLDYAGSVDEAIALIEQRNIFAIDKEGTKEEFHFLLKDKEKTVVIEFIDNVLNVVEQFVDDKPISTNLYLTGYDGTRETLTPYAQGIERQAILTDGYDEVTDVADMQELMQQVHYTKAYDLTLAEPWRSEFAGNWPTYGNLTKDSPAEDYGPIMAHFADVFEHRVRDGQTWQTVHCAVYDLEHHNVMVSFQESGNYHTFKIC